jgi:2-polyprenyl-3-methyl-5-hydroxy-6-metoxy-1,4-benzoquinol methylase
LPFWRVSSLRFWNQGWRVLDVGCGDGKPAGILCDVIPNLQIRGVEVLIRPDCRNQCESYDGLHLHSPALCRQLV